MLSRHNRIPPGVRVFSCQCCEYKCVNRNRYEEHEAKHTGEQKFLCPLCGKGYTTRRGMKTHINYHSDVRPHICTKCGAGFKARGKLYDHMKLVHTELGMKRYKCSYCNHETAQRGNCKQHVKKSHPGQPVIVEDLQESHRKLSKDYSYKNIQGDNVEVQSDVSAAKWSNIGEAKNFAPPPGAKRGTLREQEKFHNVANGIRQMVEAHECNPNNVETSNTQLNNKTESLHIEPTSCSQSSTAGIISGPDVCHYSRESESLEDLLIQELQRNKTACHVSNNPPLNEDIFQHRTLSTEGLGPDLIKFHILSSDSNSVNP